MPRIDAMKEKEWITNRNEDGSHTLKYSNRGDELTFFKISVINNHGIDYVKLNCVPINPLEETQERIEGIHPRAYPTYTFKNSDGSIVDTLAKVKKLVGDTINDADKSPKRGLSVGDINKILQKNILNDRVFKKDKNIWIADNEAKNDLKKGKTMPDFKWHEDDKFAMTDALGGVIEAEQLNPSPSEIEAAKKAGYVQGVCECVAAVGSDYALGKKLLAEMNVTKKLAKEYASPGTFKALESGVFAQKQEQKLEQQQKRGHRR